MAVLLGRVRLGPRLGGLAHLQRRLVGEADGPARAEEGVLLGGDELVVEVLLDRGGGLVDHGGEVVPEGGADERERGRGEPRLHHRPLVRERQPDRGVDQVDQRRLRVADDADGPGAGTRRAQAVEQLAPSAPARPAMADPGAWAVLAFSTTSFMLGLYKAQLVDANGAAALSATMPVPMTTPLQPLVMPTNTMRDKIQGAIEERPEAAARVVRAWLKEG